MTPDEILADLETSYSMRRFHHTLGVVHTAVTLALRHDVSAKKAELAALLHDCAKQFETAEIWDMIHDHGSPAPEDAYHYPSLWHSWLGPDLARERYGVDDPEIAEAIRHHTTGMPSMSPLGEILFVADSLEPQRWHPHIERLRETMRGSLAGCVLECLRMKRDHLTDKERIVHPYGQRALEYYEAKVAGEA